MILKYVAFWLPMLILAILNGVLREAGYRRFMSELPAHQLSTLTLIILTGCYIWLLSRWWKIESAGQALAIGVMWLALTVAFEFVFGHFVMGHPWHWLFRDYDLVQGRLWVLFLIWIAIAPYLFYRLQSNEVATTDPGSTRVDELRR